jgi:hypothetical protein
VWSVEGGFGICFVYRECCCCLMSRCKEEEEEEEVMMLSTFLALDHY